MLPPRVGVSATLLALLQSNAADVAQRMADLIDNSFPNQLAPVPRAYRARVVGPVTLMRRNDLNGDAISADGFGKIG